jgi:nucleoside-diphosphate-sugar epimerase
MSKVLVTGAGGYIGTQLVRDLVAKNHQVVALDRYFFGMEPMNEFIGNY